MVRPAALLFRPSPKSLDCLNEKGLDTGTNRAEALFRVGDVEVTTPRRSLRYTPARKG